MNLSQIRFKLRNVFFPSLETELVILYIFYEISMLENNIFNSHL
jgi:hypothetical protein